MDSWLGFIGFFIVCMAVPVLYSMMARRLEKRVVEPHAPEREHGVGSWVTEG